MKYRSGRLGEEIRRIVSDMLLRELKDPRLGGIVSISGVDVTEDNSFATLYITVLGPNTSPEAEEARREEVLAAFQSAKGKIRSQIGRKVKLRHVPDLIFKMDTSQEYGRKISSILAGLNISHDDEEAGEEPAAEDDEE